MKKIIRHFVIDTSVIYVASIIARGIFFEGGVPTLLLTGFGLTLMTLFGKPIINLLLLPLNLVTYGLFRWVSSAIALFVVDLIIPKFVIKGFYFVGLSSKWIDLPPINLDGVLKYIAFALVISVITSILYWLSE